MSGEGFGVFRAVFSVAPEGFYAVCFTLFLKPFVPEKRRDGKGDRRGRLLAAFLMYLAVGLICRWIGAPQGVFGILLAGALTAASGWYGMGRTEALWLAVLHWNVRVCSGAMAESLYFRLEQSMPSNAGMPEMIYARSAVVTTVFLFSHGIILAFMLYMLQRQIRKQKLPLGLRELCCISLVPAAGILFGQMFSALLFEETYGIRPELYERHPEFLVIVPLLALAFYGGTFLTVVVRMEMAALRREEEARFVEREQIRALRARLEETEQSYGRIRQMKHEMRGHLTNIRGLVRSGKYDDLEEYASRLEGDMRDLELVLLTGNAVTDVIVNDKRQQCQEAGILFQVDFRFPEGRGYEPFDLGIILQNLLQNALEAAKKPTEDGRFISLTGERKGRFFLIEVKNSFAGKVVFGADGLPCTTKEADILMHGLGLSNVRRTAKKYMGELELKTERQEFCAAVLLQERSGYE